MSKFYAVKAGRIPGIYTTWPECQAQINGFSGAIHKKFSTRDEALLYIYDGNIPQEVLAVVNSNNPNNSASSGKGGGLIAKAHLVPPGTAIKIADDQAIILPVGPAPLTSSSPTSPPTSPTSSPTTYDARNPLSDYKLPMLNFLSDLHTADKRALDTDPRTTIIYIDGSKIPTIGHKGSGGYCRFLGKDYNLSVPCTQSVISKYEINPEDYEKLSSPTMEFLALAEVLWRFVKFLPEQKISEQKIHGQRIPLNPRINIAFLADYIGVKCFIDRSWEAKEDYIKKIRSICWIVIENLREIGVDVYIYHIPGHKCIYGNELSDVNAKSTIAKDEFSQLVLDMSSYFQHQ